jgi:ribonuclease T2
MAAERKLTRLKGLTPIALLALVLSCVAGVGSARHHSQSSAADLMPARALVYHEWSAHGTCSGLPPAGFFALVRRASASVAIPQELSRPGQAIEQSPAAVTAAFLRANSRLLPQSVLVTCGGEGAPRLREVRVCLDRDLTPRACSADALRESCRAAQMIIPPIR